MPHPALGLVVHRGRMLLGQDHGFGLGWLRAAHRDAVARLWNRAACALLGHDRARCVLPDPRPCCVHCEEPLRRTRAELAYAAVNERLIWGDDDAG